MSAISDEVSNLVQHVKDLAEKIGDDLGEKGKALLEKLHGQAADLETQVKSDAGELESDVKTDAESDEADVKADAEEVSGDAQAAANTLTVSAPPQPTPTVPAGVPVADSGPAAS